MWTHNTDQIKTSLALERRRGPRKTDKSSSPSSDVEAIEETRAFLILSDDKVSSTFESKRFGTQESKEQVENFAN